MNSSNAARYGVNIYYAGQIGNQLFHYCLGKILAQKLDLSFIPPKHFVDWKNDPVVWAGEPLFVQRPTEGKRYSYKETFVFGAYHWYDFDSLPKNRPVHACYGHWCRYEIYREYKNQIRTDWLKIPEDRYVETDPDALYIHVRRTDFVEREDYKIDTHFQSEATTFEGFAKCVEQAEPYKKIIIATDAKQDDNFCEQFKCFGVPVEILGGTWDEDFLTLASCRQLVMSTSTYSWWAAFLGKPERIIIPVLEDTYWGRGYMAHGPEREQYPNLYVNDEPERWVMVR